MSPAGTTSPRLGQHRYSDQILEMVALASAFDFVNRFVMALSD